MRDLIAQKFPHLTNISSIGVGGQKWVFAVTHPVDGDNVLKVIDPRQTPERIDREILASQIVQSPRVPRVLEVGTVNLPFGDCVWIREERVHGKSLREHLASNGPLNPVEILRLTHQILEVLSDAEKARIVHRDVKPDNIMIDNSGDFWLLDFGIARHLAMTALTAVGAPMGACTPGYAPPEQYHNVQAEIDARADLFALGVTIHECATGIHPFRSLVANPMSPNPFEIFHQVENAVLPPLSLACKEPQSFSDLINALIGKRRDLRPRTAQEALDWINDIVAAQ